MYNYIASPPPPFPPFSVCLSSFVFLLSFFLYLLDGSGPEPTVQYSSGYHLRLGEEGMGSLPVAETRKEGKKKVILDKQQSY